MSSSGQTASGQCRSRIRCQQVRFSLFIRVVRWFDFMFFVRSFVCQAGMSAYALSEGGQGSLDIFTFFFQCVGRFIVTWFRCTLGCESYPLGVDCW